MSLMAPAARMVAEFAEELESAGMTRTEAIGIAKDWWLKQEFLQGYLYAHIKAVDKEEAAKLSAPKEVER